jgi:hypothetical protein
VRAAPRARRRRCRYGCSTAVIQFIGRLRAIAAGLVVRKISLLCCPSVEPAQLPLVPASTAVPTAATKQQNEKYNDEKRGGIHVRFPRNAAYCAACNSDLLTTFSHSSGSKYPRGEMARSRRPR